VFAGGQGKGGSDAEEDYRVLHNHLLDAAKD
jgi:hypothetical protein